jgi:hypothetical protein
MRFYIHIFYTILSLSGLFLIKIPIFLLLRKVSDKIQIYAHLDNFINFTLKVKVIKRCSIISI